MRVGVIGTGYVGSVTAAGLAEMNNVVTGVDIDEDKIARLNACDLPIYEPGLETVVRRNLDNGRLRFTTDLSAAIIDADVVFLALPTPKDEVSESADLSILLKAAHDIGPLLSKYTVLVNKSTVPAGSAIKVREQVEGGATVDFDVVSNPEFLREGTAVKDFDTPDRIVIGSSSQRARDVMAALYEPFVFNGHPIHFTDEKSAELGKYAANAFLATKISYVNFLAGLCEMEGADIEEVTKIMGSDHRIGSDFLHAGIGWGGSCFPKDTYALMSSAREHSIDTSLLEAIIGINEAQASALPDKVKRYFGGDIEGLKFALWGVAFKENTDDIREAPALKIIRNLTDEGAEVIAYDPQAKEDDVRKQIVNNELLTFAPDSYSALSEADALLIATLWKEFRSPDFGRMKKLLKQPLIFDGRNTWKNLDRIEGQGLRYESIGRQVVG